MGSQDRYGYIPHSIEQTMTRQLQSTMPAHLKQYVGANRSGYVPQAAANEISKQLQSMPAHLRQYSGAYMEQNVRQPGYGGSAAVSAPAGHVPQAPDLRRLSHSISGASQYAVDPANLPKTRTGYRAQTEQPANDAPTPRQDFPPTEAGRSLESSPYDFFMATGKKPSRGMPNFKSSKLLFIAIGGAMLVLLLFVLLSLTSGSKATPALLRIGQEQTELVRVAGLQASQVSDPDTAGFVTNTQLVIDSNQADYLGYLADHGMKLSDKQLALGQNSQTDTALQSAQSNGTLDSTVKQILTNQLQAYRQTIQQAAGGIKNQATLHELQDLYDQASLLLQQSKQ